MLNEQIKGAEALGDELGDLLSVDDGDADADVLNDALGDELSVLDGDGEDDPDADDDADPLDDADADELGEELCDDDSVEDGDEDGDDDPTPLSGAPKITSYVRAASAVDRCQPTSVPSDASRAAPAR